MPTIATVWPSAIALRRSTFIAQPSASPGKGWPSSARGSTTAELAGALSYSA